MTTSYQQFNSEVATLQAAGKTLEEATTLAWEKRHADPDAPLNMEGVVKRLMRDDPAMTIEHATSYAYRLFTGADAARRSPRNTHDRTQGQGDDPTAGYGDTQQSITRGDPLPPAYVESPGKPTVKLNADMSYTITIPKGVNPKDLEDLKKLLEGFHAPPGVAVTAKNARRSFLGVDKALQPRITRNGDDIDIDLPPSFTDENLQAFLKSIGVDYRLGA